MGFRVDAPYFQREANILVDVHIRVERVGLEYHCHVAVFRLKMVDHFAINQASLFGVFGTTWYHGLDIPGVPEFVQRYKQRWPDASIDVPGNVFYNGYMAMKTLINAVEHAGTTNNIAVIKQLEKTHITARDRMQHFDAYMDPHSHHLQQTIYIASNNDEPKLERDYYKILSAVHPKDVRDVGEDICLLESYAETPVYEL